MQEYFITLSKYITIFRQQIHQTEKFLEAANTAISKLEKGYKSSYKDPPTAQILRITDKVQEVSNLYLLDIRRLHNVLLNVMEVMQSINQE